MVIPHTIDAAVETPEAGGDFLVSMILIGLYVGFIPVTLGMLALPLLRRGGRSWTSALIAFTVGLLAFLAIDGTLEAMDLAALGSGVFGGNALVFLARRPRVPRPVRHRRLDEGAPQKVGRRRVPPAGSSP